MRRLLCTALLLLCCAYGCIAAVVQPLPQKGQGPWDTYTVAEVGSVPDHDSGKNNFEPIRFAVSAKEIDRVLAYCKDFKGVLDEDQEEDKYEPKKDEEEYGFPLDPEEISEFCEGQNEVKQYMRKTLLRKVLPAALKLHSERLSVEREKENLMVRKDVDKFSSKCSNVSVPKKHQEQGIPNVDFVLYVGVKSSPDPVNDAKICSKNENGRPTSALIKFIPKEIADTRHFIRFAAHEVAHALGFETEMMNKYFDVVEEENAGNKLVYLVKSNNLVDKMMKAQYDCSNGNEIKGMILQNKPTEEKPPHWKRRIAKDELMSPYTSDLDAKDVTGAYYTALTLAVFDSMPFYKANFDMAESMSWGKDAGCDFLKGGKEKKDEIIQNQPKMFCNEVKPTLQCTSDRFALGMCSAKEQPTIHIPYDYLEQYYLIANNPDNDLMDGYSIIKPIIMTSCEEGKVEFMPGSIVSNISRCLNGDSLTLKTPNENDLTVGDICAEVRCDGGKVHIRYEGNDNWHECNDEKSVIRPTEDSVFSSGTIKCPKYSEVCNDFSEVKDINFTIEYDEDVKLEIKKEKEAEDKAQEKKQREEEDRKKNEQEANGKAEEEEKSNTQSGLASQTQPQHHVPALAVDQRGSAVADKENVESHVSPASSQARDQRGSSAEGEKEVFISSSCT
ncbi:surface protease GP63 [Trypanosoma theileri]|uniref:Leishmanolysin-like peptidase n=1 Tax=Trypanosoma theileri TaxID=67003 RepID=A0A1X0NFK3_9TRYP|nr:surface protease GP63 [Trypanosoma theileri]ORC83437.1 surface protease GP63 [Trypanosoma theileri]